MTASGHATTLPSWSWISHFGSGAHIIFEHKRRYVRDVDYGLQLLDYTAVQPPDYNNIFGQVLSATITVRACVKWGTVNTRSSDGRNATGSFGYIQRDSMTSTTAAATRTDVASFWPDDAHATYNRYGSRYVLCILCAVASAQLDHTNRGNTKITAICVVPTENSSKRQHRRVGLATFSFEHNDWFGKESYSLERSAFYWEPGVGAYMDTIELV